MITHVPRIKLPTPYATTTEYFGKFWTLLQISLGESVDVFVDHPAEVRLGDSICPKIASINLPDFCRRYLGTSWVEMPAYRSLLCLFPLWFSFLVRSTFCRLFGEESLNQNF